MQKILFDLEYYDKSNQGQLLGYLKVEKTESGILFYSYLNERVESSQIDNSYVALEVGLDFEFKGARSEWQYNTGMFSDGRVNREKTEYTSLEDFFTNCGTDQDSRWSSRLKMKEDIKFLYFELKNTEIDTRYILEKLEHSYPYLFPAETKKSKIRAFFSLFFPKQKKS